MPYVMMWCLHATNSAKKPVIFVFVLFRMRKHVSKYYTFLTKTLTAHKISLHSRCSIFVICIFSKSSWLLFFNHSLRFIRFFKSSSSKAPLYQIFAKREWKSPYDIIVSTWIANSFICILTLTIPSWMVFQRSPHW